MRRYALIAYLYFGLKEPSSVSVSLKHSRQPIGGMGHIERDYKLNDLFSQMSCALTRASYFVPRNFSCHLKTTSQQTEKLN